jgi:cobalt/nickel transport system permease protein
MALEKLKVPGPFVVQLMFLYRYLFVLIEEASRMVRARSLRSFDSKGMRFNVFVQLLGQLLLRTLDRAQRIHLAMCCRGFDGHVRLNRTMSFGYREIQFILFWSLLFVIARWYNLPVKIGSIIEGYFL